MLVTVIVVIAVVAVVAGLATFVDRRRPDAPTTPRFAAPQQLDPADFGGDTPWLLVLFSSETCLSCHDAREVLELVQFAEVTAVDLPVETHRSVHRRYGIDAVPIMVLADGEGVVRWSWLGAPPRDAVRDILVDVGVITPDDGTAVDL